MFSISAPESSWNSGQWETFTAALFCLFILAAEHFVCFLPDERIPVYSHICSLVQLAWTRLSSLVCFVRAGVNTATTVGHRPKRRPLEKRAGGNNPNFILS